LFKISICSPLQVENYANEGGKSGLNPWLNRPFRSVSATKWGYCASHQTAGFAKNVDKRQIWTVNFSWHRFYDKGGNIPIDRRNLPEDVKKTNKQ
jgi:hypothetical protein